MVSSPIAAHEDRRDGPCAQSNEKCTGSGQRNGRVRGPRLSNADGWARTRGRSLQYLCAMLPPNRLVYYLLGTGFITGMLDATTYAELGIFASNQTGNTILFPLGLLTDIPTPLLQVGVGLAAFLTMAMVFGQIGNLLGK